MGDLVAIDLPGGTAFVNALLEAWERGDAVLPLDQRLSPTAKGALLDHLRPALVVTDSGSSRRSEAIPVDDGDALVMATSGTTGAPKGVVLTHAAVEASARATSTRLGVDADRHRWLACLPLNHIGGLSVLTRSLVTGTPCDVLPGFDAATVSSLRGPEVFVSLVTTALRRVGAAGFHTVVLGGSSPPGDLESNVVTTYGLTETGSGVVYDGVPLPGVEVAVDPGTSEISLRGPMLLRTYRPGDSPLDPEGWFATGDCGSLDDDGRLQIDGRLTDMIITGGENVWPGPVEDALRSHPAVGDAAVAGRPDPEWGQRVVAWVVWRDPDRTASLDELRAITGEAVAPYASPRQLIAVTEFPRTAIGKLRRDALPWEAG